MDFPGVSPMTMEPPLVALLLHQGTLIRLQGEGVNLAETTWIC